MNTKIFPWFSLILITLSLVGFKIHSSSIGFYHSEYSINRAKDHSVILFASRPIRTDEWLVVTPKILSFSKQGGSVVNHLLGFGENQSIGMSAPVSHWRILFHPNLLPFLFLPLENAYSLFWWMPNFFLIVGTYLLLKKLTNKNLFSLICSLVFFFTPFNQWWTYSLAFYVGYGSMVLLFFLNLLDSKRKRDCVFNFFWLTYFLLCYAFCLYPPFQISVGFFLIAAGVGVLMNHKQKYKKNEIKKTLIVSFIALFVSLSLLGLFYFQSSDAINTVTQTEYPGKRVVSGGGIGLSFFLNGFYNIQLLDDIKGAANWANQSEASNFFMFYPFLLPFLLPVLYKQWKKKKIDFLLFSILVYLFIGSIYLFFGFPLWLSKITLLYLVPNKRMLIGVGFANYFLIFYFLSNVSLPDTKLYKIFTFLMSVLFFGINLYLGYYLLNNFPLFIQSKFKILLISFIAGLAMFLLLRKKTYAFVLLLLAYSFISTYRVNPIVRGLDVILNTPLSKSIQSIEKTNKNKYRWIVYDNDRFGQYIIANGGNSISAIYYYPQYNLWHKFDPNDKYKKIWNRYAHVYFTDDSHIKDNSFVFGQTDLFTVNIDPCSKILKEINVKYYLFVGKERTYDCLKTVDIVPFSKTKIYIKESIY